MRSPERRLVSSERSPRTVKPAGSMSEMEKGNSPKRPACSALAKEAGKSALVCPSLMAAQSRDTSGQLSSAAIGPFIETARLSCRSRKLSACTECQGKGCISVTVCATKSRSARTCAGVSESEAVWALSEKEIAQDRIGKKRRIGEVVVARSYSRWQNRIDYGVWNVPGAD
jgi:hypothetical protein